MPENISIDAISNHAERLPFLSTVYFGNSIGDYVSVLLVVFGVYAISKLISLLIEKQASKITARTANSIDDQVLATVNRSLTFILVLTSIFFGVKALNVTEAVHSFTVKAVFILFTLKITREIDRFLAFLIQNFFEPLARKQKGFAKTFIPPLLRFTKIVVWGLAALLIINNLGYNISTLIAGLGIGGLAFALAAQETLANAFGSISIITDQPFKVGDWVSVEGYQGNVVDVGVRSTQIRTLDQNIVSIPNKTVAAAVIENFSQKNMIKVEQVLSFSYDTSLVKMKDILARLEKLIRRDKDTDKETIRVNFLEFGDSALEVKVFYYVKDAENYAAYLNVKQRINLKIKSEIESLGAELAFPTQSLRIENAKDFFKTSASRKASRK